MRDRLNRLRQWANKDDGRLIRVGNDDLGWLEVSGTIGMILGICLLALSGAVRVPELRHFGWGLIGIGAAAHFFQAKK